MVYGSRRRVIGTQVAGHASRVRARQIVIVADVAIRAHAWRNGVRVGERKSCGRMIELAIGPAHSVVAAFARCGETQLDVICRRGCSVVILKVAGNTSDSRQVVIVVDVAVETDSRRIGMRIRQRESDAAVVEGRWLPRAGGVALLAILRETSSDVVGVLRGLVICQMTAYAGRALEVVVVVDVTIEANPWRISMRVGQRESGG